MLRRLLLLLLAMVSGAACWSKADTNVDTSAAAAATVQPSDPPAIDAGLSVDQAYAAIPHRRTVWAEADSSAPADERAYLRVIFEVIDEAVTVRVAGNLFRDHSGEGRDSMTILKAKACSGLCLCLTLSSLVFAQERRQQDTNKSCREFVGTFYAWYLAKALRDNRGPTSDLALKYRRHIFSRDLFLQLSEDSEAQRKAGSDLVSLDGDPFIGADGPAERYVVERITTKDGRCWAEVHAVWSGKESATPDVTPELMLDSGRWIFVNFHYRDPSRPGWSSSLLDELKDLRHDREQGGAVKGRKP